MVEGKWWCKSKIIKYFFKSCRSRKPKPKPENNNKLLSKDQICRKIIGSGRKMVNPDISCSHRCRSCDAICADRKEDGLMWQCKSGYVRIIDGITVEKQIPCSSTEYNKKICCCAEYNDLLFRF